MAALGGIAFGALTSGCATSVAVDCPEGFVMTLDGTDCEPDTLDEEPEPFEEPLTCEDLRCDDNDPCTEDVCTDAQCRHTALADGAACHLGDGVGICALGACVVDCAVDDCRPRYACTQDGVRTAFADGGDLVIDCAEPTEVVLTEGPIVVAKEIVLDGQGTLTLDGNLQTRVLEIEPPAIVELIKVGITGGASPPATDRGGISVRRDSTLTLRDCRVFGNRSSETGGALGNSGTVHIINSEFFDNAAGDRGGALSNSNTMTIVGSTFYDNRARNDGGALYNTSNGVMTIDDSVVRNNVADSLGGGIWTSGTSVTLRNSTVTENRAFAGAGIRLWTGTRVELFDSVVSKNVATGDHGGGFKSYEGTLRLERTVVTQNSALNGQGGGIQCEEDTVLELVDSTIVNNVAVHGGAIYGKAVAAMRLVRSAVIDNYALGFGGGIRVFLRGAGTDDLSLENCTVSGNSAGENGGGIAARREALIRVIHTTFFGNTAPVGSAIQQDENVLCEVSASVVHGGCASTEGAAFTSTGYNAMLDAGAETCVVDPETDLVVGSEEIALGPLEESGGATATHAPNPGSVLIDAIPAESCLMDITEDERGSPRPAGAACDIGAVEVQRPD